MRRRGRTQSQHQHHQHATSCTTAQGPQVAAVLPHHLPAARQQDRTGSRPIGPCATRPGNGNRPAKGTMPVRSQQPSPHSGCRWYTTRPTAVHGSPAKVARRAMRHRACPAAAALCDQAPPQPAMANGRLLQHQRAGEMPGPAGRQTRAGVRSPGNTGPGITSASQPVCRATVGRRVTGVGRAAQGARTWGYGPGHGRRIHQWSMPRSVFSTPLHHKSCSSCY